MEMSPEMNDFQLRPITSSRNRCLPSGGVALLLQGLIASRASQGGVREAVGKANVQACWIVVPGEQIK